REDVVWRRLAAGLDRADRRSAERCGRHVADPGTVGHAVLVHPAAQLLHLELELEQAADDELQLASRRALLPAENRSDVHWKEPSRAALADLPRKVPGLDLVAGGEHDHALDQVAQL